MWRAFFLAMGISLIIIGAECLVVERVVLAGEAQSGIIKSEPFNGNSKSTGKKRILSPPAWAPWSMISAGAVVIIYSFTIPARARH